MELFEHTFFINLEERTDRLENIENELKKMGIKGERINAVKSKQGAIGCTLSHIRAIETAKQRNYPYVCIMEDDIEFRNIELFQIQLKKFVENTEIQWDVLLLAANVVPPYQTVGDYCARVYNGQTTTGYIVKKEMYDVLLENFKESAKLQMQNPILAGTYNPNAIDLHWKKLQPQYFWWIITPLTITQYENHSNVEGNVKNYDHLMLDMNKEWLFNKNNTSSRFQMKLG
uniref:Glycosyl transferase family 25 domain-containing protein n=1 Tax=viral metagenome TaxID=1070528 RepID=A0A6C0HSU4_9ZZZZ